jgi:uncharacterized protein (TIGR02147 family)
MPDIFLYSDYRKFLHDWYAEKKRENSAVSLRMIVRLVGYKSPGYLPMVISGKTGMSIDMCIKFCACMKLPKKRCDYFQNMVMYGNAATQEERQFFFDKMRSFKEAAVCIVDTSQYRYYEKWYHSAIRALLEFFPFRNEYATIGKLLIPEIGEEEVREAIELLRELRMIKRGRDGLYRPSDPLISTGYEASGFAINTFLFNSLRLAEAALERFKKDRRNFSVLTLGISEKGFAEIRQELREFRRRILNIAEEDKAESIYQLSFQLFPLSNSYKTGKKP